MLSLLAERLHHKLGDPDEPGSFSSRRRAKRFAELLRRFPDLASMVVLDLGGTPEFWSRAPVHPARVTTMNLDDWTPTDPRVTHVVADACDLASLERCPSDIDLVISNSLIEHVGGYHRRLQLAEVVRIAAPAHWVQTPDRYFPIEPHYVAPGLQFLAPRTRAEIVRRWPLAHERVYAQPDAIAQVLTIDLLSAAELRHLFPESEIWHERLCGLSKSLVAVKTG